MSERDYDISQAVSSIRGLMRKTAADCQGDPDLLAEINADARAFFAARDYEIPPGPDVRVAANTQDTFHVVMPLNPNNALADEDLARVAGGTGGGLSTHLTSPSGGAYSTHGYPPPQYAASNPQS